MLIASANTAFTGPLSFVDPLSNLTVNNTENARLTCKVAATEIPYKVTWSRNGVQIVNGDRYKIQRDGHTQMVEISSSAVPDTGSYTCTVSCPAGSVTCSANLAVIGTLILLCVLLVNVCDI